MNAWSQRLLVSLVGLLAASAHAQTVQQQAYLKANNAEYESLPFYGSSGYSADEDNFGCSMAISGDTLVIGAYRQDSAAVGVNEYQRAHSGTAYVFTRDGSGNWSQQAYLKASNTGTGDGFGYSVAISGDTIVVGAPFEDSAATGVNGDQVDNTAGESGAAYVFTRDGSGHWSQQAYLKASNTEAADNFGFSVAISGGTIVVGAPSEDSAATGVNGDQTNNEQSISGSAYVFTRNGSTWSQRAYLKADSNYEFFFGRSVALSSEHIIVGSLGMGHFAHFTDGGYPDYAAAGYVFARGEGGGWFQQAMLKASVNGAGGSFSNSSVAICDDMIVVGAPSYRVEDEDIDGVAFVFERSGVAWIQRDCLRASNAGNLHDGDLFGSSVAIDGHTILVGAVQEDSAASGVNGNQADNSAIDSGAAYAFMRNAAGRWRQRAYLKSSNTGAHDSFGSSVAIFGDTLVVGALQEDGAPNGTNGDQEDSSFADSGAAYVFDSDLQDEWPVGSAESVTGSPTVTRNGVGIPLKTGDVVYSGDIIETGGADAVELALIDETRISISENSKIEIDEYFYEPFTGENTPHNQSHFSFLRGLFVWTSGFIGERDPDDVTLDTPLGVLGIRGTEFSVEVIENGTRIEVEVEVISGAVVFENAWTGVSTELAAGESLRAEAPAPVSLNVEPAQRVVSAAGGWQDLGVTPGGHLWSWSVSEGEAWVSIEDPVNWPDDSTLRYNVLPNAEPTPRRATLTVTSGSFTATHEIHQAGMLTDEVPPEIDLQFPLADSVVSNVSPIWLRADLRDDTGLMDQVEISLNGGSPLAYDLRSGVDVTEKSLYEEIEPIPGENTLVITAHDLAGNSTTVTRHFTFEQRYSLKLCAAYPPTEDWGGDVTRKVLPAKMARISYSIWMAEGHEYGYVVLPGCQWQVTAVANAGHWFSHWSGLPAGADVSGHIVKFTMPAEDVEHLTAHFIANPFVVPAGEAHPFLPPLAKPLFLGVLMPDAGTGNAAVGMVTAAVVATKGSLSGKVSIDGKSLPFSGVLHGDGSVWFNAGRERLTALPLQGASVAMTLTASWSEAGLMFEARVGEARWSAGLAKPVAYGGGELVPAGLLNQARGAKGYYTAVFPAKAQEPARDASEFPQGTGHAALHLAKGGGLKLAGVLADGSKITAASALVEGDVGPMFVALPTPGAPASQRGGSLLGEWRFDPEAADSDVSGTNWLWYRAVAQTPATKVQVYRSGWPEGVSLDPVGAQFDGVLSVQELLELPAAESMTGNARLEFAEGGLVSGVEVTAFQVVGSKVIKIDRKDAGFSLSLNARTGHLKGSFTPNWANPTKKLPAFQGVLLQKGGNRGGWGFFLGNALGDLDPESGSMALAAP